MKDSQKKEWWWRKASVHHMSVRKKKSLGAGPRFNEIMGTNGAHMFEKPFKVWRENSWVNVPTSPHTLFHANNHGKCCSHENLSQTSHRSTLLFDLKYAQSSAWKPFQETNQPLMCHSNNIPLITGSEQIQFAMCYSNKKELKNRNGEVWHRPVMKVCFIHIAGPGTRDKWFSVNKINTIKKSICSWNTSSHIPQLHCVISKEHFRPFTYRLTTHSHLFPIGY